MQSRYYDPEMGRFINADSYTSTGQGVLGNNMFAYCNNNPILYADPTGCVPIFPVCLGGNGPDYTIISSTDGDELSKELLDNILSSTSQNYISQQYGRMVSISVKREGIYQSKSYFGGNLFLLVIGGAFCLVNPPLSTYVGLSITGISALNLFADKNNQLPNEEYRMYTVTTVWESAEYYNGRIVYVQHTFEWIMIYNDTHEDNPIWFNCGQRYTYEYIS